MAEKNLTIVVGPGTTRHSLKNTSTNEGIKILDILNPYLPKNQQLYNSNKQIEEERECWEYLKL